MGRFTSVDPLAEKYVGIAPYAYVANNPINAIDPDGKEIILILSRDHNGAVNKSVTYSNGKLYNNDGSLYKGSNKFASFVKNNLAKLESSKDNYVREVVSTLTSSCHPHYIEGEDYERGGASTSPLISPNAANEGVPQGTSINIPETEELFRKRLGTKDVEFSSASIIGHELYHAYEIDQGLINGEYFIENTADDPLEQHAINFENRIRRDLGLKPDWTYGSGTVPKAAREDISKKRSVINDFTAEHRFLLI